MKRPKIKYVSIKLPADINAYPVDKSGSPKLPNYTSKYLRNYGRKLFNILLNKIPSSIYTELVRCIKQKEKL
jgi:hypothetical protein